MLNLLQLLHVSISINFEFLNKNFNFVFEVTGVHWVKSNSNRKIESNN